MSEHYVVVIGERYDEETRTLYWELDVTSDERGPDSHERCRIEVDARTTHRGMRGAPPQRRPTRPQR